MTIAEAQLIIQLRGEVVQTVTLGADVVSIGRIPGNTIVLPHPLVARRHAELRVEGATVLLTDLESASGTLLAGVRLPPAQPTALSDGAVVQIGPYALIYRAATTIAGDPPADEPPVAPIVLEPLALPPASVLEPPRPRYPAPMARGSASRYLDYLPAIYHEADFLGRFLLIFESILEPIQQRQDHLDFYVNPRSTPAELLPWLASWLQLPLSGRLPEARRRRLVHEAMDLYRWRGTRYGLSRMIELCTDLTPEISDEPDQPAVIRVRLGLPAASGIDRQVVEELIRLHKPAHVGYILEVYPV